MANSYLTPHMSLVVPIPGRDPGPDWASNLNSSLTLIDSHDHSAGYGVQITPSGLNLSSDLTFQTTSNATNVRSVRFTSQGSLIPGAIAGTLYESEIDLYFNDGVGNQVRLTQAGAVAGAAGTISGLPSNTASAAFNAPTGTFIFQQATSTAANLDVASVAIRYPSSYPTPTGNYIQLQAPSSIVSGYAITLPALPGANNNFLTISTAGIVASSVAPDNVTIENSSNTLQVKNAGITLAKRAAANIQYSGTPSPTFTTTSTTAVDITNLTLSLTTTGRPVMIICYSAATGGDVAGVGVAAATPTPGSVLIYLLRDASVVGVHNVFVSWDAGAQSMTVPVGALKWFDTPAAGTYTYKLQMQVNSGATGSWNRGGYLAAYEF